MKKMIKIVAVSSLMVLVCGALAACNTAKNPTATPAPSTQVQTANPTEATTEQSQEPTAEITAVMQPVPEPPFEHPAGEIGYVGLPASRTSDFGYPDCYFYILHENDELVVIEGQGGVFFYDKTNEKMLFGVDLNRVFYDYLDRMQANGGGNEEYYTISNVVMDGEMLQINCIKDAARETAGGDEATSSIEKTCYVHIPTQTYTCGAYEQLEDYMNRDREEHIENIIEGDFGNAVIERDGKQYKLFKDEDWNGDSVEDMAFDKEYDSTVPGSEFVIDSADNETRLVFHDVDGIFVYNMKEAEPILSIDFEKAFGIEESIKSLNDVSVKCDFSARNILIEYLGGGEATRNALCINVPSKTYRGGEYFLPQYEVAREYEGTVDTTGAFADVRYTVVVPNHDVATGWPFK